MAVKIQRLKLPDRPCRSCPPHTHPLYVHAGAHRPRDTSSTALHTQGQQTAESVGQALTCLEMMSFPSGMGAPFSVAILFKVAMAFSWFPDSTSYLALSGSHCGRQGTQAWLVKAEQNPGSQRHTHLCVEKVRIGALESEN